MCSKSIKGFKVLPIRFSADNTSSHDLFLKEHSVRNYDESKPAGRTLFILNVPPYADEKSLKHVFSAAGKVTAVILQKSINNEDYKINCGFKVAFVVFATRESLLKALKLTTLRPLSSEDQPVKTGLNKWIHAYNASICDLEDLAKETNKLLAKLDKVETKKSKQKDEVDDDGWTVVTKKGRTPGVSRKESVENKLNDKIQAGSKKKELKNFYTFQIRESKMKNIANLRKNFEEAKQKVSLMKNARRFKPY